MCFNVNFNVFFKLIKVHLLVSEFYTKFISNKSVIHLAPDGGQVLFDNRENTADSYHQTDT